MSEIKLRRYPKDAAKLHEMAGRLEREIAERQETLEVVRKLAIEAENSALRSVMDAYNVTLDELPRLIELMRSSALVPEIQPREETVSAPVQEMDEPDETVVETEETDNE